MKQIKWFIRRITLIIFGFIYDFLIPRDKNIYLFGSKLLPANRDYFFHNTKYFFLYLSEYTNKKAVWLCDDKNMREKLISKGYKNVYSRKSIKGIYYILRAKYWFSDHSVCAVSGVNWITPTSVYINFWHGSGLMKKIGNDDEKFIPNHIIRKLHSILRSRDSYFIIDGEPEKQAFITAFDTKAEKIKLLGFPRLDALFRKFPNQDLFMEDDYKNIKLLKEQGKKLIFYMPTWRDTGKDISGWLKSDKLVEILNKNNAVLICKLHPFDTNSLNFELSEEYYKMNSDSDIYAVLKYADALITDYSSISFDFLLLDRPIIYYVPDLEEYQEQCRGFYEPYENVTAGMKAKTEAELLKSLQNIFDNKDDYKEKRKALRDRMFIHQHGGSCKRILKFIEELDK